MQATQTLHDVARTRIDRELRDAESEDPVVLWWDDGAHLRDVIRDVCDDLGVHLKAAEETPLELRADPTDGEQVWYVPHDQTPDDAAGDDYDWFRDVEATGGAVAESIESLAVRTFAREGLQAWELYDATDTDDPATRDEVAAILHEELTGTHLPTLEQLQTRIVTGGYTDPVGFVIENGWGDIDDDPETVEQVTGLLADEGVAPAADETEPAGVVTQTRRWAVAEWIMAAGADPELFPDGFGTTGAGASGTGAGTHHLPSLKSVLNKTDDPSAIAREYLAEALWPAVVDRIDDPWSLAACAVEGSLEHRLWEEWHEAFAAGRYEECHARAERRHDTLDSNYGEDLAWTRVWEQAVDVAALAHRLDSWDAADTDDVVSLYADDEEGTWQIDNAVLHLVVSGEPETDLPDDHPATETLADLRTELLQSEYVAYLEDLASAVAETVEAGAPFVDRRHAHEFFTEESDNLESGGQSVALFVIDALRLDLARELADELRQRVQSYEVDEDVWVGTLPSETEFGKAALTPGDKFAFEVAMDDGELVPRRDKNRTITTNRRNALLNGEGLSVTRDEDEGWHSTRVAYFSNDVDDMGEAELDDLEALLARRVEALASFIHEKLDRGEWDTAYVVTDHGFMLLPQGLDMEAISRPDEAEDSARRWVAGEDIDEDAPGVLLDESARLSYLDANVSVLANPLQRFRKQGMDDSRFYHGGLLPQEFVLDFISITKE